MVTSTDFSWSEVGKRIRDLRHRKGMSQQMLADVAGLTQNGIFRLEGGLTNPQLSTLQQIAAALGCSVRDLVVGSSQTEPALAERFRRVRRIVESNDPAAIRSMDNGIETAEALLERVVRELRRPPLKRIAKGEGRHNRANKLFWMKRPTASRSEASQNAGAEVVRKAGKPF